MKLGPVNKTLFGKTPRHVGLVGPERENRNQFMVFDRNNLLTFLRANYEEHNLYTRISHIDDGQSVLDKVFLDLDIEKPDDPEREKEILQKMRDDRLVADNVLGDVIEDARRAAEYLRSARWPAVGVFSGLGIHIHALTQPALQPDMALRTTVRKIGEEADLSTIDRKGAWEGDYNRLCRISNCNRIAADGSDLGVYTVPISLDEMVDLTVEDLLEWSSSPRQVRIPNWNRPEMEVHEEYQIQTDDGVVNEGVQEVDDVGNENLNEQLESFVRDVVKMPCVAERILSRNPDHNIRFQAAVLMFNCGMKPKDVKNIYRKLGWFDYDPEITESHLTHIWENRYGSMSCQSIQSKGLCVYDQDNRKDCSEFGRKGGQNNYNQ